MNLWRSIGISRFEIVFRAFFHDWWPNKLGDHSRSLFMMKHWDRLNHETRWFTYRTSGDASTAHGVMTLEAWWLSVPFSTTELFHGGSRYQIYSKISTVFMAFCDAAIYFEATSPKTWGAHRDAPGVESVQVVGFPSRCTELDTNGRHI